MTDPVVIVGGGAVGSAVAYFLTADPACDGPVVVVERDPTYARASSALSASSIRQQFSTPINIALSRFGIAFLREIGTRLAVDGENPEVGLVEPGYLFLASPAGVPVLEANHRVQRALGADVALLDPAALRRRFPWLATDGIAGGSLGLTGEGWFDGYALLQALKRKARALGAQYRKAEAVALERAGARIDAVRLDDGSRLACRAVVNAAGPWAARVAALADVDLPVRARRRSVFGFACRDRLPGCPLVIDPSGVWFRPEGAQFIGGVAPPADDDPDEDPDRGPLEPDHRLFDDIVWPALAARVPAFEAIKPRRAWAGYYEHNTFDQNGIVGRHPAVTNFIFANGFSGHGIQQAPAVGRAVAELILHGRYRSLDLAPLGFERILAGTPLRELNIV
jgi:FAD-dependent oxidoreductase domain-containing protein 1